MTNKAEENFQNQNEAEENLTEAQGTDSSFETMEANNESASASQNDELANELLAAKKEIERLKEEQAQMKDNALRALAEAENSRKRALKEKEDTGKYAISSFAKDLLSIADHFGRGLAVIPQELREENEQVANFIVGMEVVEKELQKSFERHGIKRIEPLDEIFNPNFHEVMFQAPVPGKPDGTIIQVIEPGYTLNDRLLRPARVGISSGGEELSTDSGDNESDSGSVIDTEA